MTSGPGVRRAWLWAPPLLQMAAIFVASSIPDVPAAPGGISDKVIHAVVYAALAALVLRALADGRWPGVTGARAVAAVLVAFGYGITDELHQTQVPNRHAELLDLVMDGVGAAAAAGALWGWSIINRFGISR